MYLVTIYLPHFSRFYQIEKEISIGTIFDWITQPSSRLSTYILDSRQIVSCTYFDKKKGRGRKKSQICIGNVIFVHFSGKIFKLHRRWFLKWCIYCTKKSLKKVVCTSVTGPYKSTVLKLGGWNFACGLYSLWDRPPQPPRPRSYWRSGTFCMAL